MAIIPKADIKAEMQVTFKNPTTGETIDNDTAISQEKKIGLEYTITAKSGYMKNISVKDDFDGNEALSISSAGIELGNQVEVSDDGIKVTVTDKNGNSFKTRKWTASIQLPKTGKYTVKALSAVNGTYSSTGFTTDAYAVSSKDYTVSTKEERRASDKIVQLIANWEGYSSTVYADKLTYNQVPTIGYGYTFGAGTVFYNNLSKIRSMVPLGQFHQ